MKIERTKNATRNIVFGIILKLYQTLIPFLMRTVMIYFLGMQYLGLNGLFNSILFVLNLAELGVGSAMVYSMYKPIAEDDTAKTCALLRLYKIYYRIIGITIGTVGVALLPLIPKLIKNGTIPEGINVYVLYLINLAATVFSYCFFAYKKSLLDAHQRNDISSKIILCVNTLQYVCQIGTLVIFNNYYYYLIVLLLSQILTNIVTAVVVSKIYPDYVAKGKLDKESVKKINRSVRDLFTSKLEFVIINSADTIVISAFLGLTLLAVYQNYYFIMISVVGIISVIFSACIAGVGNSIIVETKEKNYMDLQKFTFLLVWIVGVCACCLLCLYQPFMELWVGKENRLGFGAVVCFVIYYVIYEIYQLLNLYKDAAGIWYEDRKRPLVTAVANIVMNLVMVQFWGIYGVLLSTVLSTALIGIPWLLHNLFVILFGKKYLIQYIKKLVLNVGITIFNCTVTYWVCSLFQASSMVSFVLQAVCCIGISNCVYFMFYHRMREFKMSVQLLDTMAKGKIGFLKKLV